MRGDKAQRKSAPPVPSAQHGSAPQPTTQTTAKPFPAPPGTMRVTGMLPRLLISILLAATRVFFISQPALKMTVLKNFQQLLPVVLRLEPDLLSARSRLPPAYLQRTLVTLLPGSPCSGSLCSSLCTP